MVMSMLFTGYPSLNFTSEISLHHIPYLSLSPCGYINSKLSEKVDGPRPHSTCNHHVCLLGIDKLGDYPGLMVWKVGIVHHLKSHNLISFYIDEDIEGTPAEMGAERTLEAKTIFQTKCISLHLFASFSLT